MNSKTTMSETLNVTWRGIRLLHKYCPGLFLSGFARFGLQTTLPYIGIYFSARIIDELAGAKEPERLRFLILMTLGITLFTALLCALAKQWHKRKTDIYHFQEDQIYTEKLLNMDFCAVDDQHTYDLRSQIAQNARWGTWGLPLIQHLTEYAVRSVTGIIGAISLTVSLFITRVPESAGDYTLLNHPLVAVGLAICLLLTVLLAPMCTNKAQGNFAKMSEMAKQINRFFRFYGFAMSTEQHRAADIRMYEQQEICGKHLVDFATNNRMFQNWYNSIAPLQAAGTAISTVFIGIVYLFVCAKAWAGAFGVGAVTQYVGAITALSQSISMLFEVVGLLQNNTPFLRTTFEFLDIPNDMYQGSLTTEKRADRNYEVEFRDVSFKYPGAENYSLRHVSMKFKVGQRLAVVGQNGSGKTTFIKLLCRLYDPTEGEILLNGIDIRKYRYDDYLSVFSVVFQDFQLLSFPLGQNVAAKQDYERERVKDCLEKAGFGERLTRLPKGLDTCLYKDFEQEGVEISGGEAQKIAIARTLYKDAPFIILDEPTAALDPIAEAEVYTKFDEIAGDKTAIYISHRLSSCRFCDEIAVFDAGRVIQQGSHETLVADTGGKYYELWQAQAQYYAPSAGVQAVAE